MFWGKKRSIFDDFETDFDLGDLILLTTIVSGNLDPLLINI